MKAMLSRIRRLLTALDAGLSRRQTLFGFISAMLFAGAFALYNIDFGPLHNLNDIGSFRPRALFIVMTAAVHGAAMCAAALMHRGSAYRLLLRQIILTAGLFILLLGINQKTYFYTGVMQPLVRAMDAGGLGALAGYDTHLTAPAATLLYLITRGPVYDMYLVKLACIGSWLALALLAAAFAQKKGLNWRADTLLALCMILPQAFMNAGCTALTDVIALLLLALALRFGGEEKPVCRWCAAACYGLAVSVSGAALYALPLVVIAGKKRGFTAAHGALAAALPFALCLPAVFAGMPAGEAAQSLVRANFTLPLYASGAPHALSILPRAAVKEMPAYTLLEQLPAIDTVTNAQPYYTQAHFAQSASGLTIALLAAYGGVCALVAGRKTDDMQRALALVLAALLVCPGATSGAWLAADLLCLYAILAAPRLRLPACLTLFATAGTSVYPMLGETLLPMIWGFVLVLIALMMTLDMIPTTFPAGESEE